MFRLDANKQEKLKVSEIDHNAEIDVVFIRDFVVPYLSDVYYSLDKIERIGYVRQETIKTYLGLCEIVGERLMKLINVNGDPLIDHDEWLEYMLRLLCGSFERRLFIVF